MPQIPICNPRRLTPKGLVALFGALLGAASAIAQTPPVNAATTASLERQIDDAFRLVLGQPQNLSGWYKYAQLLIQAGNYEGGIAAMERQIMAPGSDPALRVEVGLLYFRLGSYAQAIQLMEQALADPRLRAEHQEQARAILVASRARTQRSQLSGALVMGVRHQTNPTYRTDASQVLSAGVLGPLAASERPTSDTDVNLSVRVQHVYDLDAQNFAAISSSFGAYLIDYRSSSGSQLQATMNKPYDLRGVDVSTGLRFKPAPVALPQLTVRPNIVLGDLTAQGHSYLRQQGVGLDLTWQSDERTRFDVSLDRMNRDFSDRIDVPAASLISGHLYGLRAVVTRELAPGRVLSAEYATRDNRTARSFYDYRSHEVRSTYAATYLAPFGGAGYWTTSVWADVIRRTYAAGDPAVSATQARRDKEWRLGISHAVRISADWTVQLSLDQSRNNANLSNFRYKNTSLSGNVVRSF